MSGHEVLYLVFSRAWRKPFAKHIVDVSVSLSIIWILTAARDMKKVTADRRAYMNV